MLLPQNGNDAGNASIQIPKKGVHSQSTNQGRRNLGGWGGGLPILALMELKPSSLTCHSINMAPPNLLTFRCAFSTGSAVHTTSFFAQTQPLIHHQPETSKEILGIPSFERKNGQRSHPSILSFVVCMYRLDDQK